MLGILPAVLVGIDVGIGELAEGRNAGNLVHGIVCGCGSFLVEAFRAALFDWLKPLRQQRMSLGSEVACRRRPYLRGCAQPHLPAGRCGECTSNMTEGRRA
jgi:hypothetical protein